MGLLPLRPNRTAFFTVEYTVFSPPASRSAHGRQSRATHSASHNAIGGKYETPRFPVVRRATVSPNADRPCAPGCLSGPTARATGEVCGEGVKCPGRNTDRERDFNVAKSRVCTSVQIRFGFGFRWGYR